LKVSFYASEAEDEMIYCRHRFTWAFKTFRVCRIHFTDLWLT